MNKLILKNYEKELLRKLEEKGKKKTDDKQENIEFIMENLNSLVVKTKNGGETDIIADSEPLPASWRVDSSDKKEVETFYLPLNVKRMVFNLLYPDGIIEEPSFVEGGNYVTRVTARVFESPEMFEKNVPLGTFSKEYYWRPEDSKEDIQLARVKMMAQARGAVLTRALGFGVGIGYETINSNLLEVETVDTNNLLGLKEEEKKTKRSVTPKKGVGEDKKTMDDFKSFVNVPDEPPKEETETKETETKPTTSAGSEEVSKDVSSMLITSCSMPTLKNITIKQAYEKKGASGIIFLAKNVANEDEKKAVIAFIKKEAENNPDLKEQAIKEKII